MKNWVLVLFCALLVLTGCGNNGESAPFPSGNISGVVMWGAGGGTDSLMRPLAALAEEQLGTSIILRNMTGAAGYVATRFVHSAAPDGYTLLMGAENPVLYQSLGIGQLTYDDFAPVFLIGDETVGFAVPANSPFDSFSQIVAFALEEPDTLRLATTGVGGLPWTVAAFIEEVTGASFTQIPYDSDATAMLALQYGEVDFGVVKLQTGLDAHNIGVLNFVAMFTSEAVPVLPNVPPIVEEFEGFRRFMPWGPFYGVFVHQDTSPYIVAELSRVFSAAAATPAFTQVLENFHVNPLGLYGSAAEDFIRQWKENTLDALISSGALDY